jgi:tetratricopeptide (TPR) repeat protein
MDLQTAYHHHQAGRHVDAARMYQALLERNPDDAAALHLFGVLHHQCGYFARAIELLRKAVSLQPEAPAFHANLAEAHRALKQYDQAVDCCRAALRLQPNYPEVANNLGLALHEMGRFDEAVAQFDAALALWPDFAIAHNNRGTSLRSLGRTEEALEAFRTAVRLGPALVQARANLGQLLSDQGLPGEGLPHCQEAVRLDPALPAAHNNLGNVLRALQRWPEARSAYAEAIRLEPGRAIAHANLGLTLQMEGRISEALPHFQRAVELAPQDVTALQHLVNAHVVNNDWATALPYCERWARLKPGDADAQCELGWIYQSDARLAEAEACYRQALELQPAHLNTWLNLGLLHEEQGSLAQAEDDYRQAEARQPQSLLPLARRADLLRSRLPDSDRDRLRFALYSPGLAPLVRMNLLFALAQVADARGDYAEAAACVEPANALAREERRCQGLFYDADEHSRYVGRLIAAFTPALFERLGTAGDPTPQPVFVFGLPRSGTTLVEQVLASHSQVYGAGELPLARQALDALGSVVPSTGDWQECLQALDGTGLCKLACRYHDGVERLLLRQRPGPAPERVVDKMPNNYLNLGLIALLFPRATLIHVRRDRRDVAVSCWLTYFRGVRWADDQDDLARRCQEHQRLMEHWRRVLPRTLHEVVYEHLVDDFETEARRLVATCGLEWEPACLSFHETARPVRTASLTQVRQPLYRRAVGRWKHYEPYLASLFARLPSEPPEAGLPARG